MEKTNARKTVNIALIGGGVIGKEHSKAYSLAPAMCPNIAATPVKKILCDVAADKVADEARLWGFEEYTTDYRDILARDDIDIVEICTPSCTHADLIIEFLKAKKFFVACEKPLVTKMEDAERVMEAVKKYNGRTATCFSKRRWPGVLYGRQLVKEGAIGKVLMYHGRYCSGWIQTVYSPKSNWDFTGGMADCGSHLFDTCRFILDDQFDSIVASTGAIIDKVLEHAPAKDENVKDIPLVAKTAEDYTMAIGKMKSGVTVSLMQSYLYLGALEDFSYEVCGDKGTIRWSAAHPDVLYLYQDDGDYTTAGFKKIVLGFNGQPYGECFNFPGFGMGISDDMAFQAQEIVNACVNGTKFDTDFLDTWEILKICDEARQSTKTKSWRKI